MSYIQLRDQRLARHSSKIFNPYLKFRNMKSLINNQKEKVLSSGKIKSIYETFCILAII